MKLIRLSLTNFRQHVDTEIVFRDGLTAIVGPNGAGKSTIVEAIVFALFGEVRDVKKGIRFEWGGNKRAVVELDFWIAGRRWHVHRSEVTGYLEDVNSNQVVANGLSAVTAKVVKLLGMTSTQFENSFCARQKGLAFLAFANTKRHEEIARMMGYERLKTASELGKAEAKEATTKAIGLRMGLADEQTLRNQIASARESIRLRKQEIALCENDLKQAQAALVESETRAESAQRYEHLIKDHQRLKDMGSEAKRGIANAEQRISEADKQIAERQALTDAHTQYLAAVQREHQLKIDAARHERMVAAQTRAARLETDLKAARVELDQHPAPDLEAARLAVQTALETRAECEQAWRKANESWQALQREAERQRGAALGELKAARTGLDKAEQLIAEGKCPTCGQALGQSVQEALDRLRSELAKAEGRMREAEAALAALAVPPPGLTQAQTQLKHADEAHSRAQTSYAQAERALDQRRRLEEQIAKLEESVREAETEAKASAVEYRAEDLAAIQRELVQLRPSAERYQALAQAEVVRQQAQADRTKAQARFDELKAEAVALRDQMATLPFESLEEAQMARQVHGQAIQRRAKAEGELRLRQEALQRAEEDHARAEAALKDRTEKEAQAARWEDDARHLRRTAEELYALRKRLSDDIRPLLEARASEFLREMTHGRFHRLKLDENFDAVAHTDDRGLTVISGGEEDVVALSLRLALSELIQERKGMPLSLLVLDEVFGSLDPTRRQSVLDQLAALRDRFEQILVISHLEEIVQLADHRVYVRRNPITHVTTVTDVLPEEAVPTLD